MGIRWFDVCPWFPVLVPPTAGFNVIASNGFQTCKRLTFVRLDKMAAVSTSNPTAEIQRDPATNVDMSQNKDNLGPEEGSGKKGRGLLKVPSKSSSHKNESPTSTGLSGPTASESRTSINRRSRDSKGSAVGRQRNGSASSKRTGGESNPTNTAGNTQPNSSVQKRKKKNGGFLSFLGCCGTPDSSNSGEGESENVHKLETLPQRPVTAKSWTPQDAKEKAANEKDAGAAQKKTQQGTNGGDDDRIVPVDGETAKTAPPAVTVEPPEGGKDGGSAQAEQIAQNEDVKMKDADVEEPVPATQSEEKKVPPPPPVGVSTAPTTIAAAGPSEPIRLLPAIRPEHTGRKCLVLDLDETLVHSSFKVS